MKNLKNLIVLGVFAIVALSVVACGGNAPEQQPAETTTEPAMESAPADTAATAPADTASTATPAQ